MTDPSYAGQIINFTFPHIGNVGANPEDIEATNPHALGCIVREDVTEPANYRSTERLDDWMKRQWPHRHRRRRHPRADPRASATAARPTA
jgi:carbamoylphosphate synthase small subunit